MTSYSLAIPSWLELSSPDPTASAAFYRQLLGWDQTPAPHHAGAEFDVQIAGSRPVASIRTAPAPAGGEWTMFIPVADVDTTVSAVVQEGGKIEQTTGADHGRTGTATCLDPHGARFTVCLPESRPGFRRGGHGTFCHAELLSLRREVAERFYGAVFGWVVDPRPRADYTYYDWTLDGADIAGLMPLIPASWPPDLLEQWIVYFQVDDCDATARQVAELGGRVEVPRDRIPPGWVLVCRDPQGTLFNVIEFAPYLHP